MNGYELSRKWFDWSFENPEKISPNHSALYFFAIEHCNRLGWREKFGFPTEMAKDAIGIKSYTTYIKTLNDLVSWGFIKMIERSKNQYSSNIIALTNFDKALVKALDKAVVKHMVKQSESTCESIVSINKHITIEPSTLNDDEKIKQVYETFIKEVKLNNWDTRIEALYMRLKIKKGALTPLLADYQNHLITENRLHKDTNEFFKNFVNWLNTQDRLGKLDNLK